jgi:hypothetical protein
VRTPTASSPPVPEPKPEPASRSSRAGQEGQALVLFSLFFTVILGMAALVLDQGMLRKTNLDLHNALDSGALAGVGLLKDDPVEAERVAREYVQLNSPEGLPDGDVAVSFRCLIGVDAGVPRLSDVPLACDPGPSVTWTIDGKSAFAPCVPAQGDICNVIVLQGPAERDYLFAPALGVDRGSTGTQVAAACKGLCGERPEVPIDLVMILDRTGSMSDVDRQNAEDAAQTVRTTLDHRVQWLGFGLLHKSRTVGTCVSTADNAAGWTADPGNPTDQRSWLPMGLTGTGASFGTDYRSASSPMARAIDCFNQSSGQGTDLADPVRMASHELRTHGRSDSIKAILLMSDGQPNSSTGSRTDFCREAVEVAAATKAQGIELYTVGFGVDDVACEDPAGTPWYRGQTTMMLAAMATDSTHDGCTDAENDDGDHYFCLPRSGDLSDVFRKAIVQLTAHSRLVKLPDSEL